jgi:hypothetical protein
LFSSAPSSSAGRAGGGGKLGEEIIPFDITGPFSLVNSNNYRSLGVWIPASIISYHNFLMKNLIYKVLKLTSFVMTDTNTIHNFNTF